MAAQAEYAKGLASLRAASSELQSLSTRVLSSEKAANGEASPRCRPPRVHAPCTALPRTLTLADAVCTVARLTAALLFVC